LSQPEEGKVLASALRGEWQSLFPAHCGTESLPPEAADGMGRPINGGSNFFPRVSSVFRRFSHVCFGFFFWLVFWFSVIFRFFLPVF
jgi:hypothetical protein